MNRTIKFRARWRDTGKIIPNFSNEYTIDACNDDAYIVEQFTGLHDKNGKEIYEGDILYGVGCIGKYTLPHYPNLVVIYLNGSFGYKINSFIPFSKNTKKLEVIGNIHDNPELLTNKNE